MYPVSNSGQQRVITLPKTKIIWYIYIDITKYSSGSKCKEKIYSTCRILSLKTTRMHTCNNEGQNIDVDIQYM